MPAAVDYRENQPAPASGESWPRVSVITPSYNQADYIEETIRSVLRQGYPDLEYIVVDGASTDQSVDIIRKYESSLSHWISEPDRGQAHAINKGLQRATGDILAWLNSDDTYLDGAILKAVAALQQRPHIGFVYGSAKMVNAQGQVVGEYRAKPLGAGVERMKYWLGWDLPQPTLFFRRRLLEQYGALDDSYHLGLDYEWIIRVSQREASHCMHDFIATYRIHERSKTGDWKKTKHRFYAETNRANFKHAPLHLPSSWPLWKSFVAYCVKAAWRRLRL